METEEKATITEPHIKMKAHKGSIATGIEITEERITGNKQKEPET